jgi:hypothetical protein
VHFPEKWIADFRKKYDRISQHSRIDQSSFMTTRMCYVRMEIVVGSLGPN